MPDEKNGNSTLAFISGWQNRAKAQQRKHRILLSATLVVVSIICILLLFWYRNSNSERIVDLNRRYVQDSAFQETNKVENSLNSTVKLIKKYSGQYAILTNRYRNMSIEDKLRLLCDNTIFDRVAFIDPDGLDTSILGTCNVADRNYFQRAMKGECGYEMIDKSRMTNNTVLVFYAPIYIDNEIFGVMAGFYERAHMDELLSYQVLNFDTQTYLLKSDGIVVGSSMDQVPAKNMLDRLSQKKFTDDVDFEDIKDVLGDNERASITFSFVDDNNNKSVGVIVQFENREWMILSVLPHTVISEMIGNANRVGNVVMMIVAITFFLLIVIFIFFIIRQDARLGTEMTVATESLHEATIHDQRQTFIVESLSNTYSSVYFINAVDGTFERVTECESSIQDLPESGQWQTAYGAYIKDFVDDNYKETMARFGFTEGFDAELEKNGIISSEYQRCDKGWRKAVLIPAERGEDGRLVSAIYAVQRIESEKQLELETQRALKEAYEAAQLASKAKTTFLSNMSHDIRTPMNAIVGMTAIAAANITNTDKVSDCLKKIASSSKHLLGLINEVLDMSKIESGKVDLNESKFSLSDLIDGLISMNQSLIKEKGHTLMVKVNNLTHENVIGDSTRLQQVFTNLLTNAIKYTPDNGKLEIVVTEKNTNKTSVGYYEVKFIDNGIGMSEEFQKNIFDPFSRADDTRLSSIQGTGLGMAIARNIVRMMNGDITVESKINKGSTFTVTFTLKIQEEEKTDYEKFVDLPVLVVDDDVTACESTCLILDSLSMKSEWVTSGREAVEKTVERHEKNDDYYAVIVDWKMPEMNGIETTKEIRKRVGNDVPIIVISAYDWTDIEQEAREAGVNAFLSKPLFKSRIIDLFAEFTGSSKANDDISSANDMRKQDFSGKRILLVEDNELNREIAVEILSIMGLEVEEAENGKIGVDMLNASEKGYYDLIFMDIQMPVMNGYEAAKTIRASSHPDGKTIPIVAMTANAFSMDVRSAFDSGMNGHISKPIDINHVIAALNEHLKK